MEWIQDVLATVYSEDGIVVAMGAVVVIGVFFWLFGPERVLAWFKKEDSDGKDG